MSDTVSGQARPAHPDGQPAKGRGAADGQAGGRSVRRRTRASRRAPTTMFDTDAANFRAMVQQFTGLPSGPYATGGGGGYNSYIPDPFLYNQQAQQRSFMSFGPLHSQEEQFQSYNSDHVTAMTGGGSYYNNNDSTVFLQGLAANYGTNFGEADGVFFRQAPTNSSTASIHDHM